MFRFSQSKHPNFLKVYHSVENIYHDIPAVKRKLLLGRYLSFLKFFSLTLAIFFILLAMIFGAQIILAKEVYEQAISGKNNLESAINLAKAENFASAIESAQNAEKDFNGSVSNLLKIKENFIVSRIPYLMRQFDSLDHLLSSAGILSRSIGRGLTLAGDLSGLLGENKKISFSKFTPSEKEKILKRIYLSGPELINIRDDLDMALSGLKQVDYNGILFPFQEKIIYLAEKIEYGKNLLTEAIPVSKIIPRLVGYPGTVTYLVLLQNSDELRPTGGFLGTYGILELTAGDITRLDTHDIYHMDMPVKDKIDVAPPEPIKKYLNKKWYMRDANWSPDWPSAAEKIAWFYQLENKLLPAKDQINDFEGDFSGVIAITPKLVTDLLGITGPIYVGGQEYNNDNFSNILEYKVEKGYVQLGVPSWQRKEVIGDIVKELKIKLFDLPSSKWGEILEALKNSALKKDVLVYVKERDLETAIKENGWGGEIKKIDNDYLFVVDANLAALKTDAVIKRSMNYAVRQGSDGLSAKLIINYAHSGKKDWRTDTYKTYTRVYVPSGSKLISSDGILGDIMTGAELDKAYFGFYLTVAPGKITNVSLEYQLPDRLLNKDKYELYLQKQPGKYVEDMTIDLIGANSVKSYSPTGFYANRISDTEIKWDTDLNADKAFKIEY